MRMQNAFAFAVRFYQSAFASLRVNQKFNLSDVTLCVAASLNLRVSVCAHRGEWFVKRTELVASVGVFLRDEYVIDVSLRFSFFW